MQGAAVTVVDDIAYLIGGRGNAGIFFEDIHEFDPSLGETWTVRKTIPGLALESGAAFTLDHQVYFGYGGNASNLQKFDPETNAVSDFGSLPGLESVDRGPVAFAIDSATAYFGLGYTSVIANQPASYRNQFWKLEVVGTSAVPSVQRPAFAKITPVAPGSYKVVGEDTAPYSVAIHSISGVPVTLLPSVMAQTTFEVAAPTGIYVFTVRNSAGETYSELTFHAR